MGDTRLLHSLFLAHNAGISVCIPVLVWHQLHMLHMLVLLNSGRFGTTMMSSINPYM